MDTLAEVQGNAQLKEQFFVSPIALQGRSEPAWKRPWQPGGESDAAWGKSWDKWQKGTRKGDFKGSRKGKEAKSGKTGKDRKGGDLVTRTPDNRLICFAYSGAGCDGSCGMVHCCQVRGCGRPHPTWQHWMEHHGASRATDGTGAKSGLSVLYLFAGKPRDGDLSTHLRRLADVQGFTLNLREIDICRDGTKSDLSKKALWDSLEKEICSGAWDVVILSPPCSTFSRARYRSRPDGSDIWFSLVVCCAPRIGARA